MNDEEARAYLQARLIVFSRMMFWSFVALLVFMVGMYQEFTSIKPAHDNLIFAIAAFGLALMAFIWRAVLVRRKVSLKTLNTIDLLYAVGIGTTFTSSAVLAPDLSAAGFVSLIFAYLSVFSRALVVPSEGRRTTIVSALALLPLEVGACILAKIGTHEELPWQVFIGGSTLMSAVAVVLATAGSRIIYGLNRQVSEAKYAIQLGQYSLDRKIGAGGMGTVWHAHHVLLRRPTAVKLLHPDRVGAANLDRFEREVQQTSRLTHPNTVAVFDYGRTPDGVFYYAMEYLGGIDLEKLVNRRGPQPAGRVIEILAQVCGSLQEAHDLGLIHRDIKPANIILCERGGLPDVAKVVDFGLVAEIATDAELSASSILGTPHYIAPEQITNPGAIGPAVDLYALGAVGYILLTGKRVFNGKTASDLCAQHITAIPQPPSSVAAIHIDAGLEALIMACLAKRAADRPASAAAFAEALRELPTPRDWSRNDARIWWRDHHAAEAVAALTHDTETSSITVDLEQRETAA